ncbi:MAG: dTMP kinase [Eubacteriaceae bacterium]|nr:dTMP kinase [Eubacteriaceae bacterium]
MNKVKLIVIEGLDGSGKETQSRLLYERLQTEGKKIKRISYPRYEMESSTLVKMYLRGDFGENPDEVSPYISSTFFAADRYASYKTELEDFYQEGGLVLADRYTTSNMVHQGGKIRDSEERNRYLEWLWDLEYRIYGIPIPDLVFFLDVPLKYSLERIKERKNKITDSDEKDIHENSETHLRNSYVTAKLLSEKYRWIKIDCLTNGCLKSIENINEEILDILHEKMIK